MFHWLTNWIEILIFNNVKQDYNACQSCENVFLELYQKKRLQLSGNFFWWVKVSISAITWGFVSRYYLQFGIPFALNSIQVKYTKWYERCCGGRMVSGSNGLGSIEPRPASLCAFLHTSINGYRWIVLVGLGVTCESIETESEQS